MPCFDNTRNGSVPSTTHPSTPSTIPNNAQQVNELTELWLEHLTPIGFALVIFLRSKCYRNPTTGETRNEVCISRKDLAAKIGVPFGSFSRVLECDDEGQMRDQILGLFIQKVTRSYRDKSGTIRQSNNTYIVNLDNPPITHDPISPKRHFGTPVNRPVSHIETPVDSPVSHIETPVDSPVSHIETPVDSPVSHIETPVDSPVSHIETPVDSPVSHIETPVVLPPNDLTPESQIETLDVSHRDSSVHNSYVLLKKERTPYPLKNLVPHFQKEWERIGSPDMDYDAMLQIAQHSGFDDVINRLDGIIAEWAHDHKMREVCDVAARLEKHQAMMDEN